MATMNIMQFAHEVGRVDRLTLEASLPFHAAWKKADKEQRAALRLEWYIGYVEGNLRVSHERAERIVDAGKHENCTTQTLRALDRAKAKFSYHVIRPEGRNEKREGAKPVRLPPGLIDALAALYTGLTKAQIAAAHTRALKALKFE